MSESGGTSIAAERRRPLTVGGAIYDSAQSVQSVVATGRNLWQYRGLIRLLAARDLTVRYKRSLLGVWWTLLNPLLTSAVMWVVFNAVFRFRIPGGVPFIVYLLSGIVVVTFFGQGLIVIGNSVAASANILTKVFVPPEVFAVASGAAMATTFALSLLPLLIIQLALGVGIPWTVLAVPVVAVALLGFVTGLGLIIASAAIRFQDVMDLVGVGVTLISYITPTFYPINIVPGNYQILAKLNPVYWYVDVFRHLVYAGDFGTWRGWLIVALTSMTSLLVGARFFASRWRSLAVML